MDKFDPINPEQMYWYDKAFTQRIDTERMYFRQAKAPIRLTDWIFDESRVLKLLQEMYGNADQAQLTLTDAIKFRATGSYKYDHLPDEDVPSKELVQQWVKTCSFRSNEIMTEESQRI